MEKGKSPVRDERTPNPRRRVRGVGHRARGDFAVRVSLALSIGVLRRRS